MKIEYTENITPESEKKISAGFILYEKEHGVEINYKKFGFLMENEAGALIGALTGYTAFAEVYIDDIWVDKAHRKKGYGKQLLEMVEKKFENKGYDNINLVTNEFQAPKFYKNCGFELEFVRKKTKNPKLTKYFFIKRFS
ncbi:GNAT family N-acetyltransferase [bacterium]|jgi:ribosomal protein S18 acetylase RimI-like enzyme|nr:GNAT family N-acetyltransferase [bacterium]MBT3580992.1 GNAT family N-acetyltransferase [bacterium]MBT4551779.1 GNAT family N-acetyltransferase [bacterium]MBT5988921.1 GNAT family N-acetyltransferase [bacterium]MBT7087439.1 GNAT family N-acetyltransferase [bacterium]